MAKTKSRIKAVIFANKEETDRRFTEFLFKWYWENKGIDLATAIDWESDNYYNDKKIITFE